MPFWAMSVVGPNWRFPTSGCGVGQLVPAALLFELVVPVPALEIANEQVPPAAVVCVVRECFHRLSTAPPRSINDPLFELTFHSLASLAPRGVLFRETQ